MFFSEWGSFFKACAGRYVHKIQFFWNITRNRLTEWISGHVYWKLEIQQNNCSRNQVRGYVGIRICTVLYYQNDSKPDALDGVYRPVIKIGPKGALGSHEIRPIHSAPSLGQSIPSHMLANLVVPWRPRRSWRRRHRIRTTLMMIFNGNRPTKYLWEISEISHQHHRNKIKTHLHRRCCLQQKVRHQN